MPAAFLRLRPAYGWRIYQYFFFSGQYPIIDISGKILYNRLAKAQALCYSRDIINNDSRY
ncbi:MAG: hypothetical protein AAGU32_05140 [Bacillota bacterium]|jgi:hypothetical protein